MHVISPQPFSFPTGLLGLLLHLPTPDLRRSFAWKGRSGGSEVVTCPSWDPRRGTRDCFGKEILFAPVQSSQWRAGRLKEQQERSEDWKQQDLRVGGVSARSTGVWAEGWSEALCAAMGTPGH